ncbi:MAG: PrgI family protein [Clostridia bacterium]
MAYVSVPKDLNDIESKLIFNLTKRQLLCFSAGGLIGLPVFFLLKDINSSFATLAMIAIMMPCFLMAMFKKHGQTFEKVIWQIITVKFFRKKQRKYKSQSFYLLLEKQYDYEREIANVICRTTSKNQKNTTSKNTTNGKQAKVDRATKTAS